MGRPPLTEDQVRARLLAYCERYGVSPRPGGLPPFPSGRRETRQHREWLTVYRALQRLRMRSGARAAPGACPICSGVVGSEDAVAFRRAGRRARPEPLHAECAELARLAERAGPEAVQRLGAWLWPSRRG